MSDEITGTNQDTSEREFTYFDPITATFYMGGQTITFTDGVCRLADPSPEQLDWLKKYMSYKYITETTPKKKTKPSKRAAKKKRG